MIRTIEFFPRADDRPIIPVWRTLGRMRGNERRPVGFLSSSPMTDRRTALGSKPRASQMTANENTYRQSRLVIQSSASARARDSGDLKLLIASSSTASIRARIPDQGGAAFVCSSVETCKDADDTSAIRFIEVLPGAGCAQALSKACAPVGLVRVGVGAVVPRVRAGNVFTTVEVLRITTVVLNNNGTYETIIIQDRWARWPARPHLNGSIPSPSTLPVGGGRGRATRRTTRVVMRAYGTAVLPSIRGGRRWKRIFVSRHAE